MLRSSSSLLLRQPPTGRGRQPPRSLSFKAFAERNGGGNGGKDRPAAASRPSDRRTKPNAGRGGGFADLFGKKGGAPPPPSPATNPSAHAPPRAAPSGGGQPRQSWRTGGGAGEGGGPPRRSAMDQPKNLPWHAKQRRERPPPPSTIGNRPPSNAGGSYGGRGGQRYDRNEGPNAHSGNRRQPQSQPTKPGEDLRDISHLRNTFMKGGSNNHQPRESWRTAGRNGGSSMSGPSRPASAPEQATREGSEGVGGKKFTPSFYKPRTPPPPASMMQQSQAQSASSTFAQRRPPGMPGIPTLHAPGGGSGGKDDVKSIEEVMKANAQQRRQDMEQRYLNAGERLPSNADEHGRSQRGGTKFAWRNNYQPGGRGGRGNAGRGGFQRAGGRGAGGRGGFRRPWGHQPQKGRHHAFRNPNDPHGERKAIRRHLPPKRAKEVVVPTDPISLKDLSLLMRVNKRTLVRTLRSLGETVAYTDANSESYQIDPETVEYICVELGIDPTKKGEQRSELEEAERRALRQGRDDMDDEAKTEEEERYASFPPRSPVVSIMGHVDHGKTTLMDALRRRAVTGEATPQGAGKTKASKKKKGKEAAKGRGQGGVHLDDENVAGTEAGGITQVITAFEVPLPLEEGNDDDADAKPISTVTFLDTPGHAAFKKMRQSGSSATDVIVLVVAADDGVSPQTVEIIDMFKSIARSQPQSISLVIAVSKIDKPGIDVDEAVMRIENQLMEHEIFTENILAGGGDEGEFGACQLFPLSGVTGEGLDDLVEGLALQSEMMDLRADDEAKGEGIVIDARMEKGLGVVADCVIRWGSISKGDFVVSGTNGGRVKFLNDVGNKPLKRGMPSQPVRIVGFKSPPKAGDPVICAASEDEAKELIRLRESELINEERAAFEAEAELQVTGTAAKQGLMMQKVHEHYGMDGESEIDDTIRIPVVIKADSHGALDAVRDALVSIGEDSALDIIIDPVEMSTGVVTSSDVLMARESDAGIFVFGKVGIADKETKKMAEEDDVSIRSHDIIYRLLEDAKEYFSKYLPVELAEKVHGRARVQAVFDVTDANKKAVSIAGLQVSEGNLFKAKSIPGKEGGQALPCFYRVLRKGEAITNEDKKIQASSLRKVKDDVDSVRHGEECGLGLDGFNDLAEGDVVECYSIEERRAAI